jgi:hypothetical protein
VAASVSVHFLAQHLAGNHSLTLANGTLFIGEVPKTALGLPDERLESMNKMYMKELSLRGLSPLD